MPRLNSPTDVVVAYVLGTLTGALFLWLSVRSNYRLARKSGQLAQPSLSLFHGAVALGSIGRTDLLYVVPASAPNVLVGYFLFRIMNDGDAPAERVTLQVLSPTLATPADLEEAGIRFTRTRFNPGFEHERTQVPPGLTSAHYFWPSIGPGESVGVPELAYLSRVFGEVAGTAKSKDDVDIQFRVEYRLSLFYRLFVTTKHATLEPREMMVHVTRGDDILAACDEFAKEREREEAERFGLSEDSGVVARWRWRLSRRRGDVHIHVIKPVFYVPNGLDLGLEEVEDSERFSANRRRGRWALRAEPRWDLPGPRPSELLSDYDKGVDPQGVHDEPTA